MSKKLKFKCSGCGGEAIEEVMQNVTQVSTLSSIEIDDNDGEIYVDYGNIDYEDGEVSHYQCAMCGCVIEGVSDIKELGEWLQDNCPQE